MVAVSNVQTLTLYEKIAECLSFIFFWKELYPATKLTYFVCLCLIGKNQRFKVAYLLTNLFEFAPHIIDKIAHYALFYKSQPHADHGWYISSKNTQTMRVIVSEFNISVSVETLSDGRLSQYIKQKCKYV